MDDAELKTCLEVLESHKPLGDWASKPAVPATTVPVTNTSDFAMMVYVNANGATIASIKVDGVVTGIIAGPVRVRSGSTITLTYTVATPTWTWFYA